MVRPPAARDLFLKDQDHSIFSLITFSWVSTYRFITTPI
jgi:hypothetical protein